jgi:apolipoprotein N-acyltransferase
MRNAVLLLALIASGAVHYALSPPLSWLVLHPISWVPALLALAKLDGRRALLGGWLIGIATQMSVYAWVYPTIVRFSNLPGIAAAACLLAVGVVFGFYLALFGWGYAAIRKLSGDWWPLAVAGWLVACEFATPQLFPWVEGVVWYQQPFLFLASSLGGVGLVSLVLVLCNTVIAAMAERALARQPVWDGVVRKNVAAFALLLAVALSWSQLRLHQIERAEATAPSSRIALVQTNQDVASRRALDRKGRTQIADDHTALMKQALTADPEIDVFVLPEGALNGRPDMSRNLSVRRFGAEHAVEIWTGGTAIGERADGTRAFYNSGFRLLHDGTLDTAHYDKNVLLPFGEFMPFAKTFPILRKIQGVGDYERGRGFTVFATPHGRFGYLICYEAILSRYVRHAVGEGVDLLVNITYDAWFGTTACPHQHLMLSAMQAAMNGVPLIRATTTGISAFVDARGVITEATGLFERKALVGDVARLSLPSPYRVLGDWVAWGCAALSALGLIRSRRRDGTLFTRASWPLGILLLGLAIKLGTGWFPSP